MNKKTLITSAAGIALLLASAAPALAHDGVDDGHPEVSTSANVTATAGEDSGEHKSGFDFRVNLPGLKGKASSTEREDRIQKREDHKASTTEKRQEHATEKAGNAIDMRIKSLEELSARIGKMKLLSADVIASIQASLATEIQALVDLKAKIGTDTASSTLKADIQSITKGNRVFLLVEPKARIAAAASRINAVVTQLTSLGGKLQERITAAQTAGTDVSAAVTAMSDFNAKIADAKVQADAAVAATANLSVDNGDKATLEANNAALKAARAKLKAAEDDLKAARKDAATIYGVVKGKGEVKASAETH